jgi:hypothetical protein
MISIEVRRGPFYIATYPLALFGPHARSPRNGDRKGEVREHCLSPRRGRVAQRPFRSSTAGKPEGPAHLGRLFFGYFLLAKQKKVAGRRAVPANFVTLRHRRKN